MSSRPMSRWLRILLYAGIAVFVCVVGLWLIGARAFYVLEARSIGRKLPFVRNTPVELADMSVSRAPGIKLSYFGFEFEVPWTDIDDAKTKVVAGDKVIIAFRSGNVVSFWSGPPHEFVNFLLEEWKLDPETFRRVYGDEALRSDYYFKRLILEATPDKITFFSKQQTLNSRWALLFLKAIVTTGDPSSGIFDIQAKELKGFQYGRPQIPPERVIVELFPDDGHLNLIFAQKKDGPIVISQSDINRIVQTIRKVPVGAANRGADVQK